MEEFPANSQNHKAEPKPIDSNSEKKVTQVTEGVRRKPALGKRMKEAFAGEDSRSVGDYVIFDVLIPAAKDTLVDAVTQGFERLVFGEARSVSRRAVASRSPQQRGYVSYNRISGSSAPKDEFRPAISRSARVNHDFDEVVIPSRAEAEEVLDRLSDVINKYDTATVADFYDLVGITGEYTDNKWGWTSLQGARVSRVRSGYIVELPKAEPVE